MPSSSLSAICIISAVIGTRLMVSAKSVKGVLRAEPPLDKSQEIDRVGIRSRKEKGI